VLASDLQGIDDGQHSYKRYFYRLSSSLFTSGFLLFHIQYSMTANETSPLLRREDEHESFNDANVSKDKSTLELALVVRFKMLSKAFRSNAR
jgi:hypothetical protein